MEETHLDSLKEKERALKQLKTQRDTMFKELSQQKQQDSVHKIEKADLQTFD